MNPPPPSYEGGWKGGSLTADPVRYENYDLPRVTGEAGKESVDAGARGLDDRREPRFLRIAVGHRIGGRAPDRRRGEIDEFGLEVLALQRLPRQLRQARHDIGRQLGRPGERGPRIDIEAREGFGDRRHL